MTKTPASVEFVEVLSYPEKEKYKVVSIEFDAQNLFGALVRNQMRCTYRLIAEDLDAYRVNLNGEELGIVDLASANLMAHISKDK